MRYEYEVVGWLFGGFGPCGRLDAKDPGRAFGSALVRLMGSAPKQLYCCTCDECRTAVNCSDDSPNCNAGNCWSVCPNIPTQKEVWNAAKVRKHGHGGWLLHSTTERETDVPTGGAK